MPELTSEPMGNIARFIRLKRIDGDSTLCVWGECLNDKANQFLCQEHMDELVSLKEANDRMGIRMFARRGFISPTIFPDLLENEQ